MDLGLQQKSVVITGGGSNIGRAITLAFAKEGANITVADIDIDQAERVASLALSEGAPNAKAVQTDVTDFKQVSNLFDFAVKQFGNVDVLVNNVGWDQLMYFSETSPEFWQKVIQLNYVTTLNCTKVALEVMLPRKSGVIVSISSDASRQGEPREAVYGGLKAATNSFMKTIAKENGRFGIRCNVVCPGLTMPEDQSEVGGKSMWSGSKPAFSQEDKEKIASRLPLRRLGHPTDIAKAVIFLASNEAAGYITGQILSVSGGYSMIG